MPTCRRTARLALLALAAVALLVSSCAMGLQSEAPAGACSSCHAVALTLPKGHPPAPGDSIAACMTCHPPRVGAVGPNSYSTRMHRTHAKAGTDCTVCHVWREGKTFGIIGASDSLGTLDAEDFSRVTKAAETWAQSSYLAARHGEKHRLTCGSCHLKQLIPDDNEALINRQCIACHGTGAQVAAKVKSKNPHIDPHKSHLGEIACTACHQGHQPSKVYCLGCHTNFVLTISGGER